jgi:hypothetical protein
MSVTVPAGILGRKRRGATSGHVAICRALSERTGRQASRVVETFKILKTRRLAGKRFRQKGFCTASTGLRITGKNNCYGDLTNKEKLV